MTEPTTTPAAWYPDPQVPGQKRWWDGRQWTEHTNADTVQVTRAQAPALAPGVKTGTAWIWLIVLLPILSFIPLLTIDWATYVRVAAIAPTSTAGQLGLLASPGYLITVAVSVLLSALTIVFAVLDSRELTKRGIVSPFHWAFAFLGSTVYVIGRSVVVKRRTGGGLAPLWAQIGMILLSFVVAILISAMIVEAVLDSLPSVV